MQERPEDHRPDDTPLQYLQERLDTQAQELAELRRELQDKTSNTQNPLTAQSTTNNNVQDSQSSTASNASLPAAIINWAAQQAVGLAASNVETTPTPDPCSAAVGKSLESDFAPPDDGTAEDILTPCADAIQKWFTRIHSGGEIKEVLKDCLKPKNCDALNNTAEINPEIAKALDKKDEINDHRLKWLCAGIIKAARPLASAWSDMLKLEYKIRKSQHPNFDTTEADPEVTITPPDAYLQLDDVEDFNVSEIVRLIHLALKATGYCHVQAVQKRRLDLQESMRKGAKGLADVNQPFTNLLFGNDLKKTLT